MIKQEQASEDSPKTTKKQARRYLRTPNQQPQTMQNIYSILHSANPILPPDVHKDYHQGHPLKFRTTLDKSKLNKTTFPQVKTRNWLNQTQTGMIINKNNDNPFAEETKQDFYQFKQLVTNKILVYCRINNRRYNRIDKDQPSGYYCSFFINSRKQEIKSRKVPIFQYMPKVYKDIKPFSYPQDIINFNSAFQSGNLFCAYKCPLQQMLTYQLYMQNDVNTKGCTQWFYFSIKAQRRVKLKLKIMNFYKPTSLYMNGMKILVSVDQFQWKRVGTSIRYNKVELQNGRQSYALEFMYQIQQFQKQHYFSYGYPYSFTHLQNVLVNFSQIPLYTRIALKSNLCQTFLGNNVPIITISSHLKQKIQKPIIYVIARQHPGQTPGSLIVQGLIRTILSNKMEMEELRDNFLIKIVPMINVDGVINGNYRSNFSGNDVNRQWHEPSRRLHPQIYTLKQQIISNKKNVHMFLDIHAHSRKMNSFFYGSKSFSYDNRLYPFVCAKLNKNINFSECSFTDDPSKKTTARVVLENQANIKKSLTFEASFYGYEDQSKKTKNHFKQEDLKGLGQSLAIGLYYSQIGAPKYTNPLNKTIEIDKAKKQQIQNAKNTVSCQLGNNGKKSKKSQIYAKIQKNCIRIIDKWKKQLQKITKQQEDAISQGSSLNPEHFQLTQIQEQKIMNTSHQIKSKQEQYNPQQSLSKNIQVLVIQQKKQYEDQALTNQKKEKQDQQIKNKQEAMKYTFFPIQSNLRNSMVVKKLQSELQMQRTHRRYQSFRTDRQRQLSESKKDRLENEIVQGKRFKSIDIEVKQPTNYKNNIIEIKKALKYFMENKTYDYKSSDYDDYKAYLKYSTNGKTLVFSDKDSIARIKKKYARI